MPPWVDTILTFKFGYATVFLIWSTHLPGTKAEKELAKGIFPQLANPAAIPIRFCSAIPILTNRSGKTSPKSFVLVDDDVSASKTTIFLFSLPSRTNDSPYASLVASSSLGNNLEPFKNTCSVKFNKIPPETFV